MTKVLIGVLIFAGISTSSYRAQASSGKEFITSAIYGTLAGTLVGAATLAFTSNPGDNLQNVARGASYGLYAGMILGIYVAYGLSDPEPARLDERPSPENMNGAPPSQNPSESNPDTPQSKTDKKSNFKFAIYPVINSLNNRDVGVGASIFALHF
jgi:Na+/proline symporter